MKCKDVEKKLIFYLEGNLSETENLLMDGHIKGCSQCSARLEYMKAVFQQLDAEKSEEVKPFLFTRIQGRMAQPQQNARRWVLVPFALMSILLVGFLIGNLVGKTTMPRESAVADAEYDVSYLFNDAQMELLEFKLLE